jgi:type IV pilus biogenesis protein PilP
MAEDKAQDSGSMRKKVTMGIIVVVLLFIVWQAYGLFSGGKPANTAMTAPTPNRSMAANGNKAPDKPSMMIPKQEPLPKPQAVTPREAELMRLQQETEAKYVAALNELQMLKIEKEIAETNKAIMSAKLDTVHAEKNIVSALTEPTMPPENYAQSLGGRPVPTTTAQGAAPVQPTESYTVISINRINYKWSAVLGYKGKLYSVSVGDTLPADESRVISIDRSNVVLQKEGKRVTISLVPLI